jgi:6-pyruvoyltetrahydropterin/6-carboxytetrahydropterin synthase
VFEITVQTDFAAAHALVIAGEREPIHGHNWHVVLTLAGTSLDGDGLLCDFHAVEHLLREVVAPWHNHNLNDLAPFAASGGGRGLNPSAENVAFHIAGVLGRRLAPSGVRGARVVSVSVSEAPGCVATYRPPPPSL